MTSCATCPGSGFKILLDIFATSKRPLRFHELPYEFRARKAGESKVDSNVALDFLTMLLQKKFGRIIPSRLIYFCVIGGTGVGLHLAVLSTVYLGLGRAVLAGPVVGHRHCHGRQLRPQQPDHLS